MPAAAYKLSRNPSRKNPHPMVVTKGSASISSRQVADRFLCGDCEQRLSKGGEAYVLGQCARLTSFKLRALLETATPVAVDEKYRLYNAAELLGSRVDQYLYFGASVFWRAAARPWTFDGQNLARLSLGAYEEELRQYLLQQAPFPGNGRLFLHVWSDQRIDFTTIPPSSYRVEGARRHKFCIPGITFILFLGREVSRTHDAGALNSGQGQYLWLCRWKDDSLFRGFIAAISNAISARQRRRR